MSIDASDHAVETIIGLAIVAASTTSSSTGQDWGARSGRRWIWQTSPRPSRPIARPRWYKSLNSAQACICIGWAIRVRSWFYLPTETELRTTQGSRDDTILRDGRTRNRTCRVAHGTHHVARLVGGQFGQKKCWTTETILPLLLGIDCKFFYSFYVHVWCIYIALFYIARSFTPFNLVLLSNIKIHTLLCLESQIIFLNPTFYPPVIRLWH
jgi:hypothetical protein